MQNPKNHKERFSRQTVLAEFGEEGQSKLTKARVLVIGCGGLGIPVAMYLNGAGVGNIGLMDADQISLSNLHRQIIFRESDIGRLKLDRLSEYLQEQNSETTIIRHAKFAQDKQLLTLLKAYDLVLDCTDNFESRYLINDACVLARKTLVYGAVNGYEGQVACFNHRSNNSLSGNYRDIFPEAPEPGTVQNCEEAGVMAHMPGIIGTIMAGEAIKCITGIGEPLINKLWLCDGRSMQTQILKYQASEIKPNILQNNFMSSCRFFEVPSLSWTQIRKWQKENKPYELIDVREINEHQISNAGGRNIPLSTLNLYMNELVQLNKPLVFYCKSGQRSSRAVHDLLEDFENENIDAYSLLGGMNSLP